MGIYQYNKIEDIPVCQCCNKPHIDVDCLEKYATNLLILMKEELEKAIQNCGILGSPAPSIDEEAQKQYCKEVEDMLRIKDSLIKELKKRDVIR